MVKKTGLVSRFAESNEQIAAMDWLRLQHPNIALYTMHIGNERKSTPYAGAIMKRMGILKGASDIFMAWPNKGYHGMFIEVKSRTGKLTKEQAEFLNRMELVGYYIAVCYGAEDVIDTMKFYLQNGI
jgi:hypothetical protein